MDCQHPCPELRAAQERIDAVKEIVALIREDNGKVITSALSAADKRMEGMNEFRKAMTDREANYANKGALEALDIRVDSLSDILHVFRASHDAKASQGAVIGLYILQVLWVVGMIVSLIHSFAK
jgi:hypothetical protein